MNWLETSLQWWLYLFLGRPAQGSPFCFVGERIFASDQAVEYLHGGDFVGEARTRHGRAQSEEITRGTAINAFSALIVERVTYSPIP